MPKKGKNPASIGFYKILSAFIRETNKNVLERERQWSSFFKFFKAG